MKQYIYHPDWSRGSAEAKFSSLVSFGHALPVIREKTERDLARKGLPRSKVLAVVVRLLESTLIRIGNREYVRENNSYGLSTLRHEHIEMAGEKVIFHFHGKSGKKHALSLQDWRLQDIPGQELFQYYDEDGTHREVESADVNDCLREAHGEDCKGFTNLGRRLSAGFVSESLLGDFMKKEPADTGRIHLLLPTERGLLAA